jgi:ParB-like chromosome segregation protein Spo0J
VGRSDFRKYCMTTVQVRPIDSVIPAPENDDVYSKIAWTDPEIHELVRSIKEHGIQEPLLISRDNYIISGHRRRQAALLAELDQCTSSGASGQPCREP